MTRGAPCSFKCKQGLQGRKRQGHQIDGEEDERGAIVSSASRGFREEKIRGAKLTEKRTRGAPCNFKCKQGLQVRKRQGRQIHREKDERCAMQFKCKQGLQGRKRQGHQIDGEEDERGAIVSSASRGSREENIRGAKLTEKRTRGAPCSFKCKQGLQVRKL